MERLEGKGTEWKGWKGWVQNGTVGREGYRMEGLEGMGLEWKGWKGRV